MITGDNLCSYHPVGEIYHPVGIISHRNMAVITGNLRILHVFSLQRKRFGLARIKIIVCIVYKHQ